MPGWPCILIFSILQCPSFESFAHVPCLSLFTHQKEKWSMMSFAIFFHSTCTILSGIFLIHINKHITHFQWLSIWYYVLFSFLSENFRKEKTLHLSNLLFCATGAWFYHKQIAINQDLFPRKFGWLYKFF